MNVAYAVCVLKYNGMEVPALSSIDAWVYGTTDEERVRFRLPSSEKSGLQITINYTDKNQQYLQSLYR